MARSSEALWATPLYCRGVLQTVDRALLRDIPLIIEDRECPISGVNGHWRS